MHSYDSSKTIFVQHPTWVRVRDIRMTVYVVSFFVGSFLNVYTTCRKEPDATIPL